MRKVVLVTGASGFLGAGCLPRLAQEGWQVHAISRQRQGVSGRVTWHRLDMLSHARSLGKLLRQLRPSHILHAAWLTGTGYWDSLDNLAWSRSSLQLLELAQEVGVSRVLGVGSCAEYGNSHEICDEFESQLQPQSCYAACKAATALAFSGVSAHFARGVVWARIFFCYGPGERPGKLIPYLVERISSGQPALLSSGEQVRDPLYVEDVSRGLCTLLDCDLTGAVNLSSGQPVAVRDIALEVGRLLGRPDLVQLGVRPSRPQEAARWVASTQRIRSCPGWMPGYDLSEGLRRSVEGLLTGGGGV